MEKERLVQYYDTCESDYRFFWDLNYSHAFHAGFWDGQTKTLREALKRENEVLAEMAGVTSKDRVLDAGCGIGGSSIFLAKEYQCQVVGITLSEKQAQTAQCLAKTYNIHPSPSFYVMDYTQTAFPDGSFDVIWGLESVCHADSKEQFIKEAARLLRKGGRLIVADGFALQSHYEGKQERLMKRWLNGWGVHALETAENFRAYLEQYGFKKVSFTDATTFVMPSARRLYYYSWPGIFFSRIGEWLQLRTPLQTENLYGARCQYLALKQGLWHYGIFYATKT